MTLAMLMVFWLDRATANAPVQHLYYLPIIFAAIRFGMSGALPASGAAIILYHLGTASPGSLTYSEADLIKMTLLVVVGVVTARLAGDTEQLRRLAMTDDLTGLHNLRSFESQLIEVVSDVYVSRRPLSMMVVDVDRLKELNDQFGHLVGAEAVRTVGHVIAASLPEEAIACRYGGDEFAIALPNNTEVQAAQFAEHIRAEVGNAAPILAGRRWPLATLSVSIGIACLYPDPAPAGTDQSMEQKGEDLFRTADRALYQAKESGRNCISMIGGVTASEARS